MFNEAIYTTERFGLADTQQIKVHLFHVVISPKLHEQLSLGKPYTEGWQYYCCNSMDLVTLHFRNMKYTI